MRKTTAFLAAFLFTASFAGSVWTVSAEETKETENTSTEQQTAAETKPEENTPTETEKENTEENKQGESSETETKPEENSTEQKSEEPKEEEPKEEHADLKKFVKNIAENDDQANEFVNKLLAHEMNAADALRDFFSKKNYDDNEEGRKQLIADLCKYVYMDESTSDNECYHKFYRSQFMFKFQNTQKIKKQKKQLLYLRKDYTIRLL